MARQDLSAAKKRWWTTVRLLRLLLPPNDERKVRVRLDKSVPDDCLGDCIQRSDHYLIRIHPDLFRRNRGVAYLVLAHEWAHARAWNDEIDHGDKWGMEMARCWRLIIGEFAGGDWNGLVD